MRRRILYVQFADPAAYPPIEHSSHILAERGWDVAMLGTDAFGVSSMRLSTHPRIKAQNASFAKTGGRLSIHYVMFFFWCLYRIYARRPDWIYASDPLTIPAIWLIAKISGVPVVYHEHDSPSASGNESRFSRIVMACRRRLANTAALCVFPQQERMRDFIKATGRRRASLCVWNCPRLGEVRSDTFHRTNNDSELIVYYHGSINRERLPETLIEAVARFKGAVRVRIAGYEVPGSHGYIEFLERLSVGRGAPRIIEFLGVISPHIDLLQSAATADVGLSLMPSPSNDINLRHMVGASNKSFDYMAAGIPLLVTDLPDWRSTFVEQGYARACDAENVDSIETQLRWYLEHPDQRREMGRLCAEKISSSWNYETMFGPVAEILEKGTK
jgi:glycosyltransferase involved in cell wall biosynthesis